MHCRTRREIFHLKENKSASFQVGFGTSGTSHFNKEGAYVLENKGRVIVLPCATQQKQFIPFKYIAPARHGNKITNKSIKRLLTLLRRSFILIDNKQLYA